MGKYYILIGEPFDFDGPDGRNRINGEILVVLSKKYLVFRSVHIINFPIYNVQGNMFLLFTRYRDYWFEPEKKYQETVGGSLILDGIYEGREPHEISANSEYVFIGSLFSEE